MIVGEFRVCNPRRSHIDWLCLRLVTIRKTGRQAGHKRAFTYIHECIYNTTLRSNDPSGNQLISHSADSRQSSSPQCGQPVGTEVSCRLLYLAVQYFRCSICAVRRIRVALPPVGCGTYSMVIHRGRSMRVERVPYRLITVATAAVFLAACGKRIGTAAANAGSRRRHRPTASRTGLQRTAGPHQRIPRRAGPRAGRRHRAAS